MPNNYLAMKGVATNEKASGILKSILPKIEDISVLISEEKSFEMVPAVKFKGRVQTTVVNSIFYATMVSAKGFSVNDSCTACGKCERVCPLNNISLKDGAPVWENNCTHCMACIAYCPTQAIEYKKVSEGQNRYYFSRQLLK